MCKETQRGWSSLRGINRGRRAEPPPTGVCRCSSSTLRRRLRLITPENDENCRRDPPSMTRTDLGARSCVAAATGLRFWTDSCWRGNLLHSPSPSTATDFSIWHSLEGLRVSIESRFVRGSRQTALYGVTGSFRRRNQPGFEESEEGFFRRSGLFPRRPVTNLKEYQLDGHRGAITGNGR